jgi:hypothetical protein
MNDPSSTTHSHGAHESEGVGHVTDHDLDLSLDPIGAADAPEEMDLGGEFVQRDRVARVE